MYKIGDHVVYGCQGVCCIAGTEERTIQGNKRLYYILHPLQQSEATYMIPTDNPAALAKMRPIITRQALDEMLADERTRESCWIADENQRKQRYRELIVSGDYAALLQMIHTLHQHKQQQIAAGRKVHMCDDNFLHDAQRLLTGEFSVVLGIAPDEVEAYVLNAMQNQ